jgi:hypothetical protein
MSMESPSSLFRFPGSEPVIRHSVNGAQHGASDQEHDQSDETREFTQSTFHSRQHIKDLIAIENSHNSSTTRADLQDVLPDRTVWHCFPLEPVVID